MPIKEAVEEIKKLLGQGGYLDAPTDRQPYLSSWRNGWVGASPLIALPSSTKEVAGIVSICARHKVALVPQGGNTGLVGGAIPSKHGDQIVINLSRMNKIRELDTVGSTVTVDAGFILQSLQEKAAEAGLLFPLSMASEGSAEIGGAISTNAGGTAVLRYGVMRDLVVGIEAILPDGRIYDGLKKLPKDNTGYNLGQYFIGSEGTLGIITAATLKLFPALKQKVTSVLAINSAEDALSLLADFRKECGEYLTAFEIISHAALKLVTKNISGTRFPGRDDAPYYLLIELGSSSQAVPLRDLFEATAASAIDAGKILDAVIAENSAQAAQFWHLREHVSEALRKEGAGLHFDISLPLNKIPGFLKVMEPKINSTAPGVMLAPFGHIGDGNLHYNMCFGSVAPNADVKKTIKDMVYAEVKAQQGSISAEHGIGVERKAELLSYKSPVAIEMMRQVKRTLDPQNIMNPGKIFD